MESNNNLKWLCFSGIPDDYPIWITRFQAFAQTKGLFETLTGDDRPPSPPVRPGDNPTNEERASHDAAEEAYRRALDDIEKRKNTLWCYLAMVLDSTSLMLIRHDCVDHKGLGDGHKAWGLLQDIFRVHWSGSCHLALSRLSGSSRVGGKSIVSAFVNFFADKFFKAYIVGHPCVFPIAFVQNSFFKPYQCYSFDAAVNAELSIPFFSSGMRMPHHAPS